MSQAPPRYLRWFSELGLGDVPLVGGKNASLGELYGQLRAVGVRVPNGFAVTAQAYRNMLSEADVWPRLHALLDDLDKEDVTNLARRGAAARALVLGAPLPAGLAEQVAEGWRALAAEYGPDLTVAVRSSATAEDLPEASFAGQHETFLNVHGEAALLDAVHRCFASVFTDRALSYRQDQGFDHFSIGLSVGVMKMVRADLGASGVIFTLDTESGFRDVVFVTGAWGLGENVVQGAVDPDEFYVHKPTFQAGHRGVLRRRLGTKKVKMIYAGGRTREPIRNVPTSPEERDRYCLGDAEVLELAGQAMAVESHYSARAGHPTPMDLEWARDGLDGLLYIVQARPETAASQRSATLLQTFHVQAGGEVLATGRAVGDRVGVGLARIVTDPSQLSTVQAGEVLVADGTTPDWEPVMKRAAAIVTNRGGRTCHAAIVARELGIPAVVGCTDATSRLPAGELVTVSCAEGDVGRVYRGRVPFTRTDTDLSTMARPATHIMMNVGDPDLAFSLAALPGDGVGLARMEFIINNHIGAHPMALLHPDRVKDPEVRARLAWLARHDADGAAFFVRALSEGVATIAAAFHPRPVVVRMSDFKTNEYASLLGGADFEPVEANPMLGFRGASRYAHPAYQEAFGLECLAMRRVRTDLGLTNVKLMIPFCRRIDEGRRVLEVMADHGLRRGEDGLEILVMCEIPNNVVLVDAFSALFDGFSIGSNDLTQLVLGVDRDSERVAFDFDERDPGVMEMMRLAIAGARRNGRHSSICGQAPSDHPEVAAWLVEQGIVAISLNPDAVLATTRHVLEVEARLGRAPRG